MIRSRTSFVHHLSGAASKFPIASTAPPEIAQRPRPYVQAAAVEFPSLYILCALPLCAHPAFYGACRLPDFNASPSCHDRCNDTRVRSCLPCSHYLRSHVSMPIKSKGRRTGGASIRANRPTQNRRTKQKPKPKPSLTLRVTPNRRPKIQATTNLQKVDPARKRRVIPPKLARPVMWTPSPKLAETVAPKFETVNAMITATGRIGAIGEVALPKESASRVRKTKRNRHAMNAVRKPGR